MNLFLGKEKRNMLKFRFHEDTTVTLVTLYQKWK